MRLYSIVWFDIPNTTQTSTNSSNNFEGANIRFRDADDKEIASNSSNLDDSIIAVDKASEYVSMGEPDISFFGCDGEDDKTSADYYFDSYSHFGIHEEMLKDVVRTKTYQNVIYRNKFLFQNKVVLDVGAGTGILSLFCAKAGAAHVYAVECSHMADMAKQIVETNGLPDGEVFKIVVSSCIASCGWGQLATLLVKFSVACYDLQKFTSLLFRVVNGLGLLNLFLLLLIKAKLLLGSYKLHSLQSKFLFLHPCQVDDGVVLPDEASLYLTAIEDAEYKDDKIEFWNNVYGFDMSCIKKQAMMEPLVDTVDQKQIVTNCHLLKTMDISKMVLGDASFTVPFKLIAERDDYIHAFVAYFDVSFTKCHKLMGFSTGPRSRATHWKQTVLYLEDVLTICEGETIIESMTVAPNKKNPRDVDIMVKYSLSGRRCVVSRVQFYKMR
ncbi:protein arginine N-methyltransferase 1.1-like [Gossypium hirsutum]|uniref:Protein arginine N-methyltransferase 1.1-like n=2 Tax=Gossypium hirsutum TaxID=3635 RepID=A0ABM2YNS4_GOSHI|nr:protein arginine N-methyltransferase 1.1-like [Gossypium hirsutum]